MKKSVIAMSCMLALACLALVPQAAMADKKAGWRNSVAGCWKTIDDKTKTVKSVVRVKITGERVTGRILKLTRKDNPKCDKCKGARKGKPITGMQIIWGMKPKKNDYWWEGGKILDPANGKEYGLTMWTKKGDKNTLFVKGWLAFFSRRQTWLRTTCPGGAKKPAKR